MTGTFIALEGPEGSGKSTQSRRLVAALKTIGKKVVLTREPGGTPEGDVLRSVLLDHDRRWSPLGEALLMNAGRDAHLREVIIPGLDRGEVVITDRFSLSTLAYQGGGGAVPMDTLKAIEDHVVTRRPDLTIVFDMPPEEGLARASARDQADRFEAKGLAYHTRVAEAFREYHYHKGHVAIDALGTTEEVWQRVREAVHTHLPDLLTPAA